MSLQAHAKAIVALLRSPGDLTVYPAASGAPGSGQGIVPSTAAPPYVAVHLAAERPDGDRLPMLSTRMVVRAYCHCVGDTPDSARVVADMVAARLLDVRPVIAGRVCWPIRHDASQPPRPDESTGALVVDLVDVYRLQTDPG